jgi:hypothetical protein
MVTRLDRLARSTFDLFGIVKRIVDAKAQFRSLAEPWADTGTSVLMEENRLAAGAPNLVHHRLAADIKYPPPVTCSTPSR